MGEDFTVGVKTDGTLWSWGSNNQGRLGIGLLNNLAYPNPTDITPAGVTFERVDAFRGHYCAVSTAGNIYCWGENNFLQSGVSEVTIVPTLIPGLGNMYSVACGFQTTIARSTSGQLYSWGVSSFNLLGPTGSSTPAVVPLSYRFASSSAHKSPISSNLTLSETKVFKARLLREKAVIFLLGKGRNEVKLSILEM